MENIVKFNYNGNLVAFDNSNGVMVNATEMAKPFGKRVSDWLSNQYTKEFIAELTVTRKSATADYQAVIIRQGGDPQNQGTWLHEDAALEFARWLSPKFAIWCNDRIKELLTKGVTTAANDDEAILHAIQVLQKRVEDSKARQRELEAANTALAEKNTQMAQTITTNAPKVLFADTVAESSTSILVGELAKLVAKKGVEIGQNRLFEWLRQNGYIMKKNGNKNYPTQRSIDLGILEVKARTITKADGSTMSVFTTKVTGKGQVYFTEKIVKSFKKAA